ncbi:MULTISPECIES: 3-isopropylmalate dehydratase [unclassified Pseudomonas]|uniref:3-isopropylmalate dehydratase n=1 Tax=unclassified Pseudomonas TaxID=196821 RepID=UPI000DA26091|nr:MULTISPECIES: 3-isopropylmalate dehydratase [unclassified Pseudomonas]
MRTLIAAAVTVMLGGCAAPPTLGEATPVASNRLLAFKAEDHGKDASVTVLRESAIPSAQCFFAVYVDGVLAARLDNNEKASFYLKPGRHLIGVGSDPQGAGNCSGNSGYKREVATWVQIGESQTFRIAFQPMLDIRPSSY